MDGCWINSCIISWLLHPACIILDLQIWCFCVFIKSGNISTKSEISVLLRRCPRFISMYHMGVGNIRLGNILDKCGNCPCGECSKTMWTPWLWRMFYTVYVNRLLSKNTINHGTDTEFRGVWHRLHRCWPCSTVPSLSPGGTTKVTHYTLAGHKDKGNHIAIESGSSTQLYCRGIGKKWECHRRSGCNQISGGSTVKKTSGDMWVGLARDRMPRKLT